jgi:hypothetical protein
VKKTKSRKNVDEKFLPSAHAQLVTDAFENSSHGPRHEIFVGLSMGQWMQLYALAEKAQDDARDDDDARRIALLARSLERAVSKSVEKISSKKKATAKFLDTSTLARRTKKWSLTSEDELTNIRRCIHLRSVSDKTIVDRKDREAKRRDIEKSARGRAESC